MVVTVVLVQVPGRRVGGSDLVGLWCRCRVDGLVVLTRGSDWVVLVQVPGRRVGGSDLVGFWVQVPGGSGCV